MITSTEFRSVLSSFLDPQEVERLLKEKDVNGDGMISYKEFVKGGEGEGV